MIAAAIMFFVVVVSLFYLNDKVAHIERKLNDLEGSIEN